MLQPVELRATLPIEIQGGEYATTTAVWQMLTTSRAGDLERVQSMVAETPGLVTCQHNYMPPLHLAVREGHLELARFLLDRGAFDPEHVTYPYLETLVTLAEDRGKQEIAALLMDYGRRPHTTPQAGKAVHGAGNVLFPENAAATRFEEAVSADRLKDVEDLLNQQPELASYEYACWGEGILSAAAHGRQRTMIDLLMHHGARVPEVAKWGRAYYFKHYDIGAYLLERGMNPNHMTWHRTTLLHDMAWEGDARKARLLLDHGADINAVDDEFRSTPLGFAARWGRSDIVRLLLDRGANVDTSGAPWATPLAWALKKGHTAIAADLRSAGAR
jgi:uncharacterized protein